MARRYEYLFEVNDVLARGLVRLWTGEASLTLLSHTWSPTNIVESVSVAGGQLPNTETRLTLRLYATTDAIRSAFLADPGPAQVTVRQVASTDDGGAWTLVPRAFTGRLTDPVLTGDRYEFDLVDRLGDPIRPSPRFWSDEDQQRRFSGDMGLKHMRQINAGVDVKWP